MAREPGVYINQVVVYAYNPSTLEVGAEGSEV